MTQNQPQQHDDNAEPINDAPAVDEAGAPETELPESDRLGAAEAELAETKDRMLRALAETENMRRRAARETEEARKYAITGFARELLEVSDNLGRALESLPDEARGSDQVKPLVEGIELTQRTLATCFERYKVIKVNPAIGEKFDHNQHQAMFEVETDEHAPGSVVQVMQPGYMLADRLLRPAMVGVAKKPAAPAATDDGDGAEQRGQHLDTEA